MVSDAPEHCSGAESNHPVFLHFELPAQGCSTPQTGTPVCGDRNDISTATTARMGHQIIPACDQVPHVRGLHVAANVGDAIHHT